MVITAIFWLFFPLLVLVVIALMWLILGVRKTDQPTCRACGVLLVNFGSPFEKCPDCGCDTTRARAVRFRGRRRPLGLWALAVLLILPVAGIGYLIVAVATGTVTPGTIQRVVNPAPITGPLTPTQAQGLSTKELLDVLGTYPEGPWGWQELRERLGKETPTDERMLAVLDSVSVAMDTLNGLQNPSDPGYDCGRTFRLAKKHLGYGHPRVQKFIKTYLPAPSGCPQVRVLTHSSKPILQLMSQTSVTTSAGSVLFRSHSSNLLDRYTKAIRIDETDVPQMYNGKRNWGHQHGNQMLQADTLPAHAFEPGKHTLEIDLMRVLLPEEVSTGLSQDLWPSNTVIKSATITCEYTIKEPPKGSP